MENEIRTQAQNWFEYMLDNDYIELTKRHFKERIDNIFWVVNLSDASKAVEVLEIYFKEFGLDNIKAVAEHFKRFDKFEVLCPPIN